MINYNTNLGMRDIFLNPALKGIFPQMDGVKLQNVYSFAEVEKRVQTYLAQVLNARYDDDGELVVKGKHKTVINRVKQLTPLIEGFFNNMPKIVAGIRRNTPLYLPYASIEQLKNLHTTAQKIKAMQAVMDNFQYRHDLGVENSISNESDEVFARKQKAWQRKVGYSGRLKRV